ncbi:spore germination protein [Neobacillus sp. SM06]|uniref:spore germination protein n=1 Tax=Neobacillus sp. SM06 TaxID=3422492 RepID=UPI003D287D30
MSLLSSILKKRSKIRQQDNLRQQADPQSPEQLPILKNCQDNLQRIKEELGNSTDIVIREFQFQHITGAIVYIDGISDSKVISEFIIETLMKKSTDSEAGKDPFQLMLEKAVSLGSISQIRDWDKLYESLLSGDTIIFLNGYEVAIGGSTRGGEKRAITEPTTQLTIRGPKDAFTESFRTNTSLIRRRIKSPNLWLETMKIGTVTQTDVGLMYIKGIANEKIITEAKERLKRIQIDSILESGYIEQLIEDQTWTTFPTVYHTERPDVVCSQLLEGRVAIFIDGTPFVLTAPAVFIEFFQAADDYYSRFDISTGIRLLRITAFFISLIGPAIYIAATTFHQEMIPTTMAIAIAAQRENVPFPAFVEALIMEITFEILREAGLRLPRAVGQAVSIVGALVIGQAAVQAGFVSPVMVIVVSITAIANFSTPTFAMAISTRLLRFIIMGVATFLGFYGVSLAVMVMTIHLCSLRSFGVPYMAPIAPFSWKGQQDVLIRFPIWAMKDRPQLISKNNLARTGKNQKPQPPQKNDAANSKQQGDQK